LNFKFLELLPVSRSSADFDSMAARCCDFADGDREKVHFSGDPEK
jgi:hypothetical protein